MLEKFKMSDSNPASTPLDHNQVLSKNMHAKDSGPSEMANVPYQEAVGSILYLSQVTRPDIAHAVNTVSKFNKNPCKIHWTAVKRILRYLKGTISAKLEFCRNEDPVLTGFCDADWGSDIDDRRSCTGYVFKMNGGAVSWNSKRQATVALSTTEAEYMGLSSATQEAMWLRQLRLDLLPNSSDQPIKIFCDNKSAISLSHSDGYNARTKHIDIRHHFIRNKIEEKKIQVEHIVFVS